METNNPVPTAHLAQPETPAPQPLYTKLLPALPHLIPLPSPSLHFQVIELLHSFLPSLNSILPLEQPTAPLRIVKDQHILLHFLEEKNPP